MDKIFENDFTLEEWETSKRKEFLDLMLHEEYGFRNKEADKAKLKYRIVEEETLNGLLIQKVIMTYMDLDMRFYLYRKNDGKRHPGFVFLLHEYAEEHAGPDLIKDYQNFPTCPVDDICNRGYFVAVMPTREIAQDGYDFKIRRKRGIFETINVVRDMHDWGTLAAWSWGLSKVMDYLEKQDYVDKDNVAVIGHSRGGKTALITGAQDTRFKLTVSSCSGQSGAAISRNRCDEGETIRKITTAMSIWFASNYFKYADHPELVPFDQHHLLAMMAPRYLYVFSAKEDINADPASELLSCRYASSYFNLYGVKGLIAPESVEINKSYNEGHIAYHIKDGGHCLQYRDWTMVMDYFDKIVHKEI